MCKLSKEEFFASRRCKEKLTVLFHESDDVAVVLDNTLDGFSPDIVKAVIAATILSDKGNAKVFSVTAKMWASQYIKKLGFLKDSIGLPYCSGPKIEQLLMELIKK